MVTRWPSIAFVERTAPGQQIWVVGVDDGVARAVSNATDINDVPAWSPDGIWLAYSRQLKPYLSNGQFVIVRPDGSGETVLAPQVASGPAWSPDGRTLVGTAYEDPPRRSSIRSRSSTSPMGQPSSSRGVESADRAATT